MYFLNVLTTRNAKKARILWCVCVCIGHCVGQPPDVIGLATPADARTGSPFDSALADSCSSERCPDVTGALTEPFEVGVQEFTKLTGSG